VVVVNAKLIAVITVLASLLGAHFAALLLSAAAITVLIALGVLTERIAVTLLRDGWRIAPKVVMR
jgi:hypothetical protein